MSRYILRITVAIITIAGLITTLPAYSQIDYFYGKDNAGLRVSAGIGASKLVTHYNTNPLELVYQGSIDYDFSPFLSVGLEGQYGTLKGVDTYNPGHLYYSSSTNQYRAADINVKLGVGEFIDFYPKNKLMDAVKRIYIGAGYGKIKNKIDLTYNSALDGTQYGDPQTYGLLDIIPMNIGTYVSLPNVLGYDRIEINPNYQFTYIPSMYSDGFISSSHSHLKGFYNLTSINIRFKF